MSIFLQRRELSELTPSQWGEFGYFLLEIWREKGFFQLSKIYHTIPLSLSVFVYKHQLSQLSCPNATCTYPKVAPVDGMFHPRKCEYGCVICRMFIPEATKSEGEVTKIEGKYTVSFIIFSYTAGFYLLGEAGGKLLAQSLELPHQKKLLEKKIDLPRVKKRVCSCAVILIIYI